MSLGRYYDWLSRFQQVTGWIGRGGGYHSLTVHRLLKSDDAAIAPADVVHERLLAAAGAPDRPRVIDAGCGLGGTIFYFHRRLGGTYRGLTLSRGQRARAAREARRRGVADDCTFHLRSYDDDLGDLLPGGADLVVAIESLAHAADPCRTIANLARALRGSGRLIIVDDVPEEGLDRGDADFAAFRAGWDCPAVATLSTLTDALHGAGLTVDAADDLTALVTARDGASLERLVRSNRRWRVLAGWTGAGQLIDSLYGGLMLERLYRRGVMRYRLVAARRTESSG